MYEMVKHYRTLNRKLVTTFFPKHYNIPNTIEKVKCSLQICIHSNTVFTTYNKNVKKSVLFCFKYYVSLMRKYTNPVQVM